MKKLVLGIFVLLLSHIAHAANVEFIGVVKGFYVDKNGIVLVNIENPTSSPMCSDPTWPFTFNISDSAAQYWLSMLLASRTTKDTIKLGYTTSETGRCEVRYFYYLD